MLDGLKTLVIRIGIENIIEEKFIADALADIESIEKLFANELPTQKDAETIRQQIAKDAEMTPNDLI